MRREREEGYEERTERDTEYPVLYEYEGLIPGGAVYIISGFTYKSSHVLGWGVKEKSLLNTESLSYITSPFAPLSLTIPPHNATPRSLSLPSFVHGPLFTFHSPTPRSTG